MRGRRKRKKRSRERENESTSERKRERRSDQYGTRGKEEKKLLESIISGYLPMSFSFQRREEESRYQGRRKKERGKKMKEPGGGAGDLKHTTMTVYIHLKFARSETPTKGE